MASGRQFPGPPRVRGCPHVLAKAYRLDLWWAAERCLMEMIDGHAVLRFINGQMPANVRTVVPQIEQLISDRRRTATMETRRNG